MEKGIDFSIIKEQILNNQETFLSLVYQPKVRCEDNTIHSCEVLMRCHLFEKEVPLGLFLQYIKESELECELDLLVIRKLCQEMKDMLNYIAEFSVNISLKTLSRPKVAEEIIHYIQGEGISPERITLEVLEDVELFSHPVVMDNLKNLSKKGLKISMDDFGTGYATYSRLLELKFDEVKIPREFIMNNKLYDVKVQEILRAIISMSKAIGCRTVAEGIETLEEKEIIASLGIDYIQGYYYSKPLNKYALIQYLEEKAYLKCGEPQKLN